MNILRKLLRVLGLLGVLLLSLLTMAVSAMNMTMVTQYWVLIVGGGMAVFLGVALLAGALSRLVWKAPLWKGARVPVIIACVFLAQLPLHLVFNSACSLAVQSYLAKHASQLESYHKEHGRYPGTFEEVLKGGGVMSKLAGQWSSYSVYNERSSFRLSVQQPVFSGQHVYDPATKGWK